MIVVIQCAARKRADAGYFETADGRRVCFVADPRRAPLDGMVYARPDDPSDAGRTWRELLLDYNRSGKDNRLRLARAFELYENAVYTRLGAHVGIDKLYILSAGWGLIPASFLTPVYDITFSAQADRYKRREKSDDYGDFCMLPAETTEPIVFFGSKEYTPLFGSLTSRIAAPKIVFYTSGQPPEVPGCRLVRFSTTRRTNWHYECANAFLDRTG